MSISINFVLNKTCITCSFFDKQKDDNTNIVLAFTNIYLFTLVLIYYSFW